MRHAAAIARGAAAGVASTMVMSAVLELGQRTTPFWRQPPTLIIRRVLAGDPAHEVTAENPLAVMAHLGYGTSCGSLFALLTERWRTPGPTVGVGYALLLYTISYAGWVPTAGVMPPPHRDRPGRQITLIVGHVVYGAVLAMALRRLRRRSWK